ncbi:FecR domain-containing protein [Dongia sp.]|uniref:FecR family protein n=1 Tax=Dongia sp. TaxID=1977262 RepID=UPI0035AE4FCE
MALSKRDFLRAIPLAAAGFAFFPTRVRAAEGVAGRISRLAGTVAILRDGTEVVASVGAEILVEDTLRSAAESRAEVTFSDGSVLTIGPASEVAIAFFAPEPSESHALLDLVSGIARLTVNKATSWGRFEVRTTTAVASVRGTDYLVEALPGKSAVFVAEGRVAVSSRAGSGTVVLREGQGVDVPAERGPLVAKNWGAKRRDEALARVTFP